MAKVHGKINQTKHVNQDKVTQAIFNAAESMGITDRKLLEKLSEQVIQRLNSAKTLPGMENFVSSQLRYPISDSKLQTIVNEIISADEFSPQASSQVVSGIKLSDNAMRVLKKRYLKKDKEGKVIETPQELFRRVAKHIASAELLYNTKADTSFMEEVFYQLMAHL